MNVVKAFWNQFRSLVLSWIKRSFKTHSSLWVTDLVVAQEFYARLGFRSVLSTRNHEVLLLRNHRGDELNLVADSADTRSLAVRTPSSVSFEVDDWEAERVKIHSWYPNLVVTQDALSKQMRLLDPDANQVQLIQRLDPKQSRQKKLYHVVIQSELLAGLSEHYYVPPTHEQRFVYAPVRSAFITLACNRVAQESDAVPMLLEMDRDQLSVHDEWIDEASFDAKDYPSLSTYPQVNSPISRQAIISVGRCGYSEGDLSWPSEFTSLDRALSESSP